MKARVQNTQRGVFFVFVIVIAALFLSGVLAVRAADAATYYVATTGSDSNSGTLSSPFKTISRGVTMLRPGDTLYVRAGAYVETLYCPTGSPAPGYVCIPSGTSWSYPVTVAAYPGETVTIRPSSGLRVFNFNNAQAYIVIDSFIIDGSNVGYDAVQIQGAANHIRIQHCEIKNSPSNGIHIAPDAHYNEVLNNAIHDIRGTNLTHGVYVESSNNLIVNNVIHHCPGYGVHIYNSYPGKSANNNLIYKNKIYANGTYTPSAVAGILLSSGSNNIAYNNLLWSNPVGIKIGYRAAYCRAFNNTVYANTASSGKVGIYVLSSSTGASIVNNIAYQNGSDIINQGSGTTLSTNLTGNPAFIDPANFNFMLQSSSPAINKGTMLSQVKDDFTSVARPQGYSYDIGAYEYK